MSKYIEYILCVCVCVHAWDTCGAQHVHSEFAFGQQHYQHPGLQDTEKRTAQLHVQVRMHRFQ